MKQSHHLCSIILWYCTALKHRHGAFWPRSSPPRSRTRVAPGGIPHGEAPAPYPPSRVSRPPSPPRPGAEERLVPPWNHRPTPATYVNAVCPSSRVLQNGFAFAPDASATDRRVHGDGIPDRDRANGVVDAVARRAGSRPERRLEPGDRDPRASRSPPPSPPSSFSPSAFSGGARPPLRTRPTISPPPLFLFFRARRVGVFASAPARTPRRARRRSTRPSSCSPTLSRRNAVRCATVPGARPRSCARTRVRALAARDVEVHGADPPSRAPGGHDAVLGFLSTVSPRRAAHAGARLDLDGGVHGRDLDDVADELPRLGVNRWSLTCSHGKTSSTSVRVLARRALADRIVPVYRFHARERLHDFVPTHRMSRPSPSGRACHRPLLHARQGARDAARDDVERRPPGSLSTRGCCSATSPRPRARRGAQGRGGIARFAFFFFVSGGVADASEADADDETHRADGPPRGGRPRTSAPRARGRGDEPRAVARRWRSSLRSWRRPRGGGGGGREWRGFARAGGARPPPSEPNMFSSSGGRRQARDARRGGGAGTRTSTGCIFQGRPVKSRSAVLLSSTSAPGGCRRHSRGRRVSPISGRMPT